MTARAPGLLGFLLASASLAACASSGGVPRPQPFPGAKAPAATAGEADAPASLDANAVSSRLVDAALALRGTPYLNGGSEPSKGFDCSGLVQWVFAQYGTALPREVHEQFRSGRKVDQGEVLPGDLVFFETVSRGPSHVGIALGDGEFVHAPSSRGVVRVERYTTGYWSTRWVGARRLTAASEAARTD